MNTEAIPPEARMMQTILQKWISRPVHAATELGIADLLSKEALPIEQIAERTGTQAPALYRMMRALAGVGIFRENEDRVFANTDLSACLAEGCLRSAARMFLSDWHDKVWQHLLYTIRTGRPAFEKAHGEPAFQWFRNHPGAAQHFHGANARKAAMSHSAILDVYDFSQFDTVVDVGGGLGGLSLALVRAETNLTAVVFDRPETIRRAIPVIEKNGLGARIQTAPGNFFSAVPPGADAYILSHVLHDWPDDSCCTILQNCRHAMGPQARLLIVEAVVPAGNEFHLSKLMDLEVMVMGGGCERSATQWETLLKDAGFQLSRTIPTPSEVSLLECRPTPAGKGGANIPGRGFH